MVGEAPSRWRERAAVKLLACAPLRAYTQTIALLSNRSLPRKLRRPVWNRLCNWFDIDLAEAELEAEEYATFRELFVRRLKPGRRPVDGATNVIVSPVDGRVSSASTVCETRVMQAKGIDYSLEELLGDAALANAFDGGAQATLYLRPKDYHRIHSPVAGEVLRVQRFGGRLFPVQPWVVRNLKGVFVRNERLVVIVRSDSAGLVAVVAVGATGVGTISTPFDECDHLENGQRGEKPQVTSGVTAPVAKGDEIAAFNLGSTVIVLFQQGVELNALAPDDPVFVGAGIGRSRAQTATNPPSRTAPGPRPGPEPRGTAKG